MVEWLETLGCGAKWPEGREIEIEPRHRRLQNSVSQAVNGFFFEPGKGKAVNGEGWAPLYISCAQDTMGL